VSKTYQRKSRRTQAAAGAAMPEHVQVAMAEIAVGAKEDLPALAVRAGMQVMAAMLEESERRMREANHAGTALDAEAKLTALA
jgi:hypothetical protein